MVVTCKECNGRGWTGNILLFWKIKKCEKCNSNGVRYIDPSTQLPWRASGCLAGPVASSPPSPQFREDSPILEKFKHRSIFDEWISQLEDK